MMLSNLIYNNYTYTSSWTPLKNCNEESGLKSSYAAGGADVFSDAMSMKTRVQPLM